MQADPAPPSQDPKTRLATALVRVQSELLGERGGDGHWRGELSASALSTATAAFTLLLACREKSQTETPAGSTETLLCRALDWLAAHVNDDGGWGDTVRSRSNLSTTTICWATLAAAGAEGTEGSNRRAPVVEGARRWIEKTAGSLEPVALARAIEDVYGEDRTFSIPILTLCALAGCLGPPEEAFRRMPALPFELAALPQATYNLLGLPVVSYALPALIAVGQVQHHHAPSSFAPIAGLRQSLRGLTLRRLEGLQPESGGFLEAIPLTSFVAMSLLGAGSGSHPVVRRCLAFLASSVRSDGSWAIDVDLATWVTTLSVQALSVQAFSVPALSVPALSVRGLSASGPAAPPLQADEREKILCWLLDQQWCRRHPYTGSPPGGWAWTDLSGGVPDADDTAGALLALHALGERGDATRSAASAGLARLLGLQNRDGGIPTFCRGWGKLPFDRSAPDLTAHAVRAWALWRREVDPKLRRRIDRGLRRALAYLRRTRRADGSWHPLWFGCEAAEDLANPTFGTARVVRALQDVVALEPSVARDLEAGQRWLLEAQNSDGGWGGAKGVPSSVEETSLALEALASSPASAPPLEAALNHGGAYLCERIEAGATDRAEPIGFYFANLWYYERLYPLIFSVAALRRLLQRS